MTYRQIPETLDPCDIATVSILLHAHVPFRFSCVLHAMATNATALQQFRSAVVKRRFEAGDFAAHAASSAPSPCLPVASAIHFPDIAAMHLVRIFDYCRTEWPSDRADASARHASEQSEAVMKYQRMHPINVYFPHRQNNFSNKSSTISSSLYFNTRVKLPSQFPHCRLYPILVSVRRARTIASRKLAAA